MLILTEQNSECNARVQVSDSMLRRCSHIKDICLRVNDIHGRKIQAGNWSRECQLNRPKPQEVKDNTQKLFKQFNVILITLTKVWRLNKRGEELLLVLHKTWGWQQNTAQKRKFSIKNLFSKCDQIRKKQRISLHLLNTSLIKNFSFYPVNSVARHFQNK